MVSKKRYQKVVNLKRIIFGNVCYLCSKIIKKRATVHEKFGKNHEDFTNYNLEDLKKEWLTGNYVLLHFNCHNWLHRKLGLRDIKLDKAIELLKCLNGEI